jgi:hypothetical protein
MSITVFCICLTYPGKTNGAMGPGFFPMIIAGIIFSLCMLLLVSIRKQEHTPVNLFTKTSATIFISLLITIGYVIFMNILGFPLATFIYLVCMMKFYGIKKKYFPFIVSACTTGFVYGVFTMFLSVQMPRGLIF